MQDIGKLTDKLFGDTPQGQLYHYTTLTGLLGIITTRTLWASDIRYMNDSAELKHSADLIKAEVQQRIAQRPEKAGLLGQFVEWVTHRITNGHMLFGASFRSHGNLLSQWRGYSTHGKGVSLGFSKEYILQCAEKQHFKIGKCIYNPERQLQLIKEVVDAVEAEAEEYEREQKGAKLLDEIYRPVFEKMEIDLLKIAAVLKHPSFREEEEWRVVSPVYTSYTDSPILFREANAMLVPYIEFDLKLKSEQPPQIEHVFLGPTSNTSISMNSLKMFLSQHNIFPAKGIDYCQIPFRQR